MTIFRTMMLGVILSALSLAATFPACAQTAAPPLASDEMRPAANRTIAVSDFSGADEELGRFLADTLLTDLAHSEKLILVERAELKQAFAELKLQSTGLIEPQQVTQVGKIVGADCLIVGSYLLKDGQLLINARLLNVQNGRLMSGGGASVAGASDQLLPLVHRLAHLFHQRVTGEGIRLDDEPEPTQPDAPMPLPKPTVKPEPPKPEPPKPDTLRRYGLIPTAIHASDLVTERELAEMCEEMGWRLGNPGFVCAGRRNVPVERLYALTTIVNAALSQEKIYACFGRQMFAFPPDFKKVPYASIPYIKAAIDQGWWSPTRYLLPDEKATWDYISSILAQMPLVTTGANVRRYWLNSPRPPIFPRPRSLRQTRSATQTRGFLTD